MQNAYETCLWYRSGDQEKFATYLDLHSIAYSKLDKFLFEQVSMPLFSHKDTAIWIIVPIAKLKTKSGRWQPRVEFGWNTNVSSNSPSTVCTQRLKKIKWKLPVNLLMRSSAMEMNDWLSRTMFSDQETQKRWVCGTSVYVLRFVNRNGSQLDSHAYKGCEYYIVGRG